MSWNSESELGASVTGVGLRPPSKRFHGSTHIMYSSRGEDPERRRAALKASFDARDEKRVVFWQNASQTGTDKLQKHSTHDKRSNRGASSHRCWPPTSVDSDGSSVCSKH